MKSKPMTKSERRRMRIVNELGCMACIQDVLVNGEITYRTCGQAPAHAHHVIVCGSRVGHLATYGLCDDHHVGNDMSVHKTKRKFNQKYGTDGELLTECNRLIKEFEARTVR